MRTNVKTGKVIPKAFIGKRSPLNRYYYARSSIVKWQRAENVLTGMRWNYYLTTGKNVPTIFFEKPKHEPIAKGTMRSYNINTNSRLFVNHNSEENKKNPETIKVKSEHTEVIQKMHLGVIENQKPFFSESQFPIESVILPKKVGSTFPNIEKKIDGKNDHINVSNSSFEYLEVQCNNDFRNRLQLVKNFKREGLFAKRIRSNHPKINVQKKIELEKLMNNETKPEIPHTTVFGKDVPLNEFKRENKKMEAKKPDKLSVLHEFNSYEFGSSKKSFPSQLMLEDKQVIKNQTMSGANAKGFVDARFNDNIPRVEKTRKHIGYYSYGKKRPLQLKTLQGAETLPPE